MSELYRAFIKVRLNVYSSSRGG